jgi:hypothetical protein
MPSFRNVKDLEQYIMKQVADSLDKDVAEKTKQLMSDNVDSEVYRKYPNPVMYEARMNDGGLSDVRNMNHFVVDYQNSKVLFVTNETMSNEEYLPEGKTPFQIAGVVEFGHNAGYGEYDYVYDENAKYLQPRRFLQKTREDLKEEKGKEFLKDALVKRGFKVK